MWEQVGEENDGFTNSCISENWIEGKPCLEDCNRPPLVGIRMIDWVERGKFCVKSYLNPCLIPNLLENQKAYVDLPE